MRAVMGRWMMEMGLAYGRRKLELTLLARYLRDGWGPQLLRLRAQQMYVPSSPVTVGIELTNVCQLRCPHCDAQHPAIRGKPGYMSDETFARLVAQLRELRVRNLRMIGGGEPLLHPRFSAWVPQLRGLATQLSITTNGQRLTPEITAAALDALEVIEVSVASDHAEGFERSRTGGDFEELLENLVRLRALRRRMRSRTLLHIRVMLRPSELPSVDRLLAFWSRYGDAVSTQRLQDYFDQDGDIFVRGETEPYPPCVLPFRSLGVSWDGDVPLCRTAAFQTGQPQGVRVGNINETTMAELWRRSTLYGEYREGHRRRDPSRMPVCHRCPDPQRPRWSKAFETNAHITRASERPDGFVPVHALKRRANRPGS